MRKAAEAEKRPLAIRSPWRDRDPGGGAQGRQPFVIRLKAPREGETVIDDQVQGRVVFANKELDDLIILRSDGDADLQSRRRRRRPRHGHHARHPRRRPPHQRRAPDADLRRHGLGGADLRARAADPRRPTAPSCRSATARSASRPTARWAICRPRCATIWCGSAGATATTRSCRPRRWSTGSISTASAARPARFDFAKLEDLNGHYIRQHERSGADEAARGHPAVRRRTARRSWRVSTPTRARSSSPPCRA